MKKLSLIIVSILLIFSFTSCEYSSFSVKNKEVSLVNEISLVTMRSVVTVVNTRRNNTILSKEETLQGSGVIIENDENKFKLLTNNHVVDKGDFSNQSISIIDCFGNVYTGYILKTSVSDDLALLYFQSKNELNVIEYSDKNPKAGDSVVSLGVPYGQRNFITIGVVSGYKVVETVDEDISTSNVTYPVLTHNCPIDHGSSGGALINYDKKLVGINFAGANDENDSFAEAYSIPIEKVKEFYDIKNN